MHPSLSFSSLNRLPRYQRVRRSTRSVLPSLAYTVFETIAAAAAQGFLKHLASLCAAILVLDFSQDQIVLSLPALYLNLDPGPIPDPNALDNLLSTGIKLPCIDGAAIALNGLASMSRMGLTPIDASHFLWPRAWKWIDFLHTYWDYLPGFLARMMGLRAKPCSRMGYALDGVALTRNELMAPTIRFYFDELLKYLLSPPECLWVNEVPEAGLLQVIVSYGATANPDASNACSVYLHIQQLLGAILQGALMYHRSVAQIKESFKDIKFSPTFKISPVFEAWEVLAALIETPCDNMNCGKIDQKDKFNRCAGCNAVYYCSRKCQASDWRNGHRDICQELASVQYRPFRSIVQYNPETLNTRERSFVHAVLHHDYEELIYNVSYLQMKFIHEHPTEQFVTQFDYSRPFGVPIDVIATSAVPTIQLEDFKIEWRTRLARAARSGGKLEMHVIFLLEPSETAQVSLTLFHAHSQRADLPEGQARNSPTALIARPTLCTTKSKQWDGKLMWAHILSAFIHAVLLRAEESVDVTLQMSQTAQIKKIR
ncbi:hypothetical protein DFH09DRAFT_1090088 [Mycena vulgaris]|nr:hypothetical protein DFH09DRAFT_1090088 [Mycena vulgaris]